MKAYQECKDSGVEWIGNIPTHWTTTRIKSVVESIINGVWGDDPQEDENDIICVRVADFDMQVLGVGKDKLTTRNIPENQQGERLLATDDLLIEKSGGGEIQPVGRAIKFDLDEKAVCSNFIGKVSVNKTKAFPSFLLYYLSNLYSKAINTRSIKQTTGIQNLDTYSYFSERISLPPLPEQQAIADFLDRKTAQIDTLIEKKQRQIELLQEQRTALINHAVTKGLNPNAKMKDSGMEWLGEIPSHWEVMKVKRYIDVIDGDRGSEYPNEKDYVDSGIPFLSSKNIIDNKLDLTEVRYISQEKFDRLGRGKLVKNDLVITVRGTIGSIGYFLGQEHQTAFINAQMMILRTNEELSSKYFYYFARSNFWFTQLDYSAYGAAQQQLSNVVLQNLSIVVPPFDEQVSIENYLDQKLEQVEKTTQKVRNEITLLEEYRTALISEAVTGKIDVRTAE